MNIRKFLTKLFPVAVTELAMMLVSLSLTGKLYAKLIVPLSLTMAQISVLALCMFIVPILVCLLYMAVTYREKLSVFTAGGAGRCLKGMGIGLAIGFLMNGTLCLLATASGSVQYTFQGFDFMLIPAFGACFIQCAAEEVLLRGYATSYLEENYSGDVVAFVGGVLFIFHHIGNMRLYGFHSVFCLNVLLIGVVLYLAMKVTGSIWTAFGIHTAWNYTQSFIFGSENSGKSSALGLFSSSGATDSFFCDTVYGNEGTYMCVAMLTVAIAVLYAILQRQKKKAAAV